MSVQASSWVIEHSRQKGSALLVMLMIANHAHADGTNAFPSIQTLARECRMSARQITRIVAELERSGELQVERSEGRLSHRYALPFVQPRQDDRVAASDNPDKMTGLNPDKMSPLSASTLTNPTPNPDKSGVNPDIAMSPEPIEPSKEPKTKKGADAPPRREPKAFDPRIIHPAIKAVRSFIHCLPDEQNRDEVIEALGDAPDMPKLAECYRVWKKQGWNKVSLVPATEWYVHGVPEKYMNGGENAQSIPHRNGNRPGKERLTENARRTAEYFGLGREAGGSG
jgi:hypothetical protein